MPDALTKILAAGSFERWLTSEKCYLPGVMEPGKGIEPLTYALQV